MLYGKRLLLVDADAELLRTMTTVFEAKRLRVMTATDGRKAWGIIQRQKPDCLVVAMVLPYMGGFVMLSRIQKRRLFLPTVLTTTCRGSRHQEYAKMLGAHAYLQKPYAFDNVVRAVDSALELVAPELPQRVAA